MCSWWCTIWLLFKETLPINVGCDTMQHQNKQSLRHYHYRIGWRWHRLRFTNGSTPGPVIVWGSVKRHHCRLNLPNGSDISAYPPTGNIIARPNHQIVVTGHCRFLAWPSSDINCGITVGFLVDETICVLRCCIHQPPLEQPTTTAPSYKSCASTSDQILF